MPTSISNQSNLDRKYNPAEIKAAITERANSEGFDAVGFASPADPAIKAAASRFRRYLELEHHGDMSWLSEPVRLERRLDPLALWPDCNSIIMLAMSYGPERDPLAGLANKDQGVVSCYAQGRDYHDVVKKALKRMGRWLAFEFGGQLKVFVDTAPVLEKPLAALAGIGWQGKHSNLVSRDLGSWFFLGAIYSDMSLPVDDPHPDHCGQCRACVDVCPTDAIIEFGIVDARRCISYLTIEHLGHIDRAYRSAMGNRIYGCDDCLAVCPWNKFAVSAGDIKLQARRDLIDPSLADLAVLDDAGFRKMFSGTAIKRLGRDRFVRNVLIAIGNSDNADLIDVVKPLLRDTSSLVRAMAVWALGRLVDNSEFEDLRPSYLKQEGDPNVIEEWQGQSNSDYSGAI